MKENARRHVDVMKKAEAQKVDLTCFPELSLSGYSLKDRSYEVVDDCEVGLNALARRTAGEQRVMCGYVK